MIENKNKISIFVITFLMILNINLNFTFADTNGVWHLTNDIRGGTFGTNELDVTTNYTFIHPVYFKDNLYSTNIFNSNNIIVNNKIGIKTQHPQAELDVNGTILAKDMYMNGKKVATVNDLSPLASITYVQNYVTNNCMNIQTQTVNFPNTHFGSGYNEGTYCRTYPATKQPIMILSKSFSKCVYEDHGWKAGSCSVSIQGTSFKVCISASSHADGYGWTGVIAYLG